MIHHKVRIDNSMPQTVVWWKPSVLVPVWSFYLFWTIYCWLNCQFRCNNVMHTVHENVKRMLDTSRLHDTIAFCSLWNTLHTGIYHSCQMYGICNISNTCMFSCHHVTITYTLVGKFLILVKIVLTLHPVGQLLY